MKAVVGISVLIFSLIGGYIPSLWGSSFLSLSSLVGNTIGGIFGIWAGIKIGNALDL